MMTPKSGATALTVMVKPRLHRLLMRTYLGKTFIEYYPKRITLDDGTTWVVPRKLWDVSRLRHLQEGLGDEMRGVYAAYRGGDFLDVGAFHGWYSVLLAPKANKGDRFVSFEPDPEAYPELLSYLSIIARLFPDVHFWPVPQPVGDGNYVTVSFPDEHKGHPQFASGNDLKNGVTSLAIDALVHELDLHPTFVKIDVEGAEYFVLRGMQQTIKDHHPTVMLEIHPKWQPKGVTIEDIQNLLKQHDYTFTELDAFELAVRQLWK